VRLVLDTNTMVAAIRSDRGASRRLVSAVLQRRGSTLLVTVPLLIEYEAVMTRDEHLKAAGLSAADVNVLLDAIAAVSEAVTPAFLWRPLLADPGDDMVLEAAVNGRAEGIVTFNRRHIEPAAKLFGIAVLSAAEAVKRVEKRS
jgi:predicted nucleic acid-binding protein